MERKPSHAEVDIFAKELCVLFDNYRFYKWYCGVIYEFGIERTRELVGRTAGSKQPGRLFSSYVEQERKRFRRDKRLGEDG